VEGTLNVELVVSLLFFALFVYLARWAATATVFKSNGDLGR
jgi:hypothetical protein